MEATRDGAIGMGLFGLTTDTASIALKRITGQASIEPYKPPPGEAGAPATLGGAEPLPRATQEFRAPQRVLPTQEEFARAFAPPEEQPIGVIHNSAGERTSSESPALPGELLSHERVDAQGRKLGETVTDSATGETRTVIDPVDYPVGTITPKPGGVFELAVAPGGEVRPFDSYDNAERASVSLGLRPEEQAPAQAPEEVDTHARLRELVDRLGPRMSVLSATPEQLSEPHTNALREAGVDPANYQAFYDRHSKEFYVNPNTVTTERGLNDAIIRNFIPNSFSDYARIIPIDSWSQVAENPAVARLLDRNPQADTNTSGLFDPQSGNTYLNVQKHLNSPDPVDSALRTVVHEVVGHQGLRALFASDYRGYDDFLGRVYNGMIRTGMGDSIAAEFGTNLKGLAQQYGLGTLNDAGELSLKPRERARLAEELLARYSEKFDPHKLEAVPEILDKAIHFVRDGLERFQGIKLSRYDSFRSLQESFRGIEGPRSPESQNALLAKQIAKSHEPPQSRSIRAADPNNEELELAARLASPLPEGLSPSRGNANSDEQIRLSSERLRAHTTSPRRLYTESQLRQRTPVQLSSSAEPGSVEYRLPLDPERNRFLLAVSRPDSVSGPYGPAPSFPGPSLERGKTAGERETFQRPGSFQRAPDEFPQTGLQSRSPYGNNQATAADYLRALQLRNEFFGTGDHFEGIVRDEPNALERIISSQPRVEDPRPASVPEIADYMASRGFHSVDDSTYYNPEARVLVLQGDPANVVIDGQTGHVVPTNVAPFEVTGELANHLEQVVGDPARLSGVEDPQGVIDQLRAHGTMPGEITPEMERSFAAGIARDEAELTTLRAKAQTSEGLTPQEEMRMDQIEYGPLLARDIERELGPGSDPNEEPINLLRRAIEDQRRANPPGKSESIPAGRKALDPTETRATREFNAADSQRLLEKGSNQLYRSIVDQVFSDYRGDWQGVLKDLVAGKFDDPAGQYNGAIGADMYAKLKDVIRQRWTEAEAEGNQAQMNALDSARASLDDWDNKRRRNWGQQGAKYANERYSGPGFLASVKAAYQAIMRGRVGQDGQYELDLNDVRRAVREATDNALNHPEIRSATDLAQKANDQQRPKRIADALTSEVARALGLDRPTPKPTAEQRMARAFVEGIKNKLRLQLPRLERVQVEKVSATDSVRQAIAKWPEFEKIMQDTVREMRQGMDPTSLGLFLTHMHESLDAVPFTQSDLEKVIWESNVSIRDLVKLHRSQTDQTINRLRDDLANNSALTPEQAKMLEGRIDQIVSSLVEAQTRKEFERIVERRRTGKPVTPQDKAKAHARLLELVHMGAFGDAQVADALGPLFGFKGYQPELDAQLREQADRLEQYRNEGRGGFQTEEIKREMFRSLANYMQERDERYWLNLMQGNLISGPQSHLGAFVQEMLNGSSRQFAIMTKTLGLRGMADPSLVGKYAFNYLRNFGYNLITKALPHAGYTLKTGLGASTFVSPEEMARIPGRAEQAALAANPDYLRLERPRPQIFENQPTQRRITSAIEWFENKLGVPLGAEGIGRIAGVPVDLPLKYVFRSVKALHGITKDTFAGSSVWQLALRKQAENPGTSIEQAIDLANDQIYGSSGQREAARQQIAAEGIDPKSVQAQMRMHELLEANIQEPIKDHALDIGTEATMMNKPRGLLGVAEHMISMGAQRAPVIRFVFPIVRVAANVLNSSIENSPLGFAILIPKFREWHISAGDPNAEILKNPERKDEMYHAILTQAALSVAGLGAAAAGTLIKLPNGQPLYTLTGSGPSDKDQRYQWLDAGHKPYTIEFGGQPGGISYEWFPQFLGLAAIGNYHDALAYPDKNGPSAENAFWHSVIMSPYTFVDRSFIRGLYQLVDAVYKARDGSSRGANMLQDWFANQTTPMTPILGNKLSNRFTRRQ